jgi:hypothetical protein
MFFLSTRACQGLRTGAGAEFGSGSTNLGPVLTASAPTRLGPPVLYGSGLFGAGSDAFMHSIVFNAEIEMNAVRNSVPEPVPGPKIGSGSEQS